MQDIQSRCANVSERQTQEFCQTLLERYPSSFHLFKKHVEVLGKESFRVKSETTSAWYRVELGDSERYPSCECVLFKTTFLPCKHFFAVFSHSDKTWGDLSPVYCRSPYITLDFSVALTNPPITENTTQEDFSSDFCVSPLAYPRKQTHNSEPQSTGVGADQQHLREELKQLHDVSYMCNDKEAIQNASCVVHELCKTLKSSLPKDHGLVLQQQEAVKQNLRPLPSRSKKAKQKTVRKRKMRAMAVTNEVMWCAGLF
ncbi:hypothetical protein UPYG_G00079280 [Umbra pygmaea]|uniref:SWIM-type domain-containing protein n=1 Tax=Umbra pygmaea TaxID=75934 RepID=A0ABD0XDJ7_UMBPY